MNSAIIFLSIVVIIVSCMIVIHINLEIAPLQNRIFVIIKFFNLRMLTIKISIIGLYYQINNSKKLKSFNIFLNKEQEYLFLQIKKNIVDKLYYDDINLQSYIGLWDASSTAILVGFLDYICNTISNKFILNRCDTKLYYDNKFVFTDQEILCIIDFKVYITVFDLIFAIITSFYKRNRYVKERKKAR